MKLQSFMNVFKTKKTDDDRLLFIKEHMVKDYIPYERKVDIARAIIDTCYWHKENDINGKEIKVFHVDSIAKYMITCVAVIDLFTTIERDKVKSNTLDDFNLLNSSGALDLIIQKIDPKELKEFNMVLKMTEDDLMTNEYENHAFIRSQVERFGTLIGATLAPFLDQVNLEELKAMVEQMRTSNGVDE